MNLHPKVQAAALAGAVVTVVVFSAQVVGVNISDSLVAALTTILTFAAGYFTPSA